MRNFMDHDALERIRIISERFIELQGLRLALMGSVFTLVFGIYLIAEPPNGSAIWIAMAVSFALGVPAERWVSRHYESTYGRLSPKRATSASGWGFGRGIAIGIAMLAMDKVFGVPPPASVLVFGAPAALWIVIRDWPLRRYHLGAAVAWVCALLLQTTSQAAVAPDMAAAAGFLLIGVVYVPIGFLDHRLLVSAMRRQGADDSVTQPSA